MIYWFQYFAYYFIGLGRIKPLELNILYHWVNIGTLRGLFYLVKNLMLVPTGNNLVTGFFRWIKYTIISLIFLAIGSNLWTNTNLVHWPAAFFFHWFIFIFSWLSCWCFRCYFLKCWQVAWTPHCMLSSKAVLSWWLLKLISIVVEFIPLCEGIFILYSNL